MTPKQREKSGSKKCLLDIQLGWSLLSCLGSNEPVWPRGTSRHEGHQCRFSKSFRVSASLVTMHITDACRKGDSLCPCIVSVLLVGSSPCFLHFFFVFFSPSPILTARLCRSRLEEQNGKHQQAAAAPSGGGGGGVVWCSAYRWPCGQPTERP